MNIPNPSILCKTILGAASVVCCFTDLVAQDTCELFTIWGLQDFHAQHIDPATNLQTSFAPDSLHFFFKDESLPVLEAFLAWGKAYGFSTGMIKGVIRDGQTLHFIKLSTVLDDLSFKRFTNIVDKVLTKKKELKMDDCGAMGVGHPNCK